MEYLCAVGVALKTFLFDWGVLLEVISIAILAPLTAALVERDRRRRLRNTRRSAAFQLYFECLAVCGSFKQAFLALKGAVDTEDIDRFAKLGHIPPEDPQNVSVAEQNSLRIHLEALRYSRTLYIQNLESAERALGDIQRRCARVKQDLNFFNEVIETEQIDKLADAREGLNAIDDCCYTFVMNIRAEIQNKKLEEFAFVDFPKVISWLREFIESFGHPFPQESWYVRAFDWLRRPRAEAEPEVPLLRHETEHFREQFNSLETKNLLVSNSDQQAVAEGLQKVRRIQRYDFWIEETLRWLGHPIFAKGDNLLPN